MHRTIKIIATFLLIMSVSNLLAGIDQMQRGSKKAGSLKKDSINNAIIKKQDSLVIVTTELNAQLKIGEKPEYKDSLKNKKDVLVAQIDELKKINPVNESEIQSNMLSISALVFGGVLIISVLLFKRSGNDTFQTYKLIGIMFIGTVSVFLIPAGFDNNQITPIVGLLGTLAGYLVGSQNNNNSSGTAGAASGTTV